MSGMVSKIKESRLYEFISIEPKGVVEDGKEKTTGEEVKEWAGSFENYTLKEIDGKTEVIVDLAAPEEFCVTPGIPPAGRLAGTYSPNCPDRPGASDCSCSGLCRPDIGSLADL